MTVPSTTDSELDEVREVARRFLAARSSEAAVRHQIESASAWDPVLWQQMAGQLGLQSLAIPAEFGGSDAGLRSLAVVMEEGGRSLLCAPFLETAVMSVSAVRSSRDAAAAAELLPGIAAGDVTATIALSAARLEPAGTPVRAQTSQADTSLHGVEKYVPYGGDSDFLLVFGSTDDQSSLYLVEGDAPGVSRYPLRTLDPTRRAARVVFDGAPARLVGETGSGRRIATEVLRQSAIMLAAEQVGLAGRIFEITVDYARTRVQFGRTIGSFQAVKHKLADLFIALTLARSLTQDAVRSEDDQDKDADIAVSASALFAGSTAVRMASQAIQIHAGIGFTWEHSAHLFLKRAKSNQLLFQDNEYHRQVLKSHLLNDSSEDS